MIRRPVFTMALAVLFMLLYSVNALAIYSWVDEKGQLHIADYPKPTPAEPEAHPSDDADKEKKSAAPEEPEPALKAERPQPGVENVPPPAAAAVPLPASPKKEQPVASPSPQQQPGLKSVSSPTAPTTVLPAQSSPTVSPIVPQQRTPINKSAQDEAMRESGVPQLIKVFMSMFLIFIIVGYFYFSLCLYNIARKLNVSNAWIAWVPIAQILTLLQSASKPAWWILLFLVPLVNLVITIYVWMCVSENLGKNKWLGLLMLVPVVNLVYLGMLAFSRQGR